MSPESPASPTIRLVLSDVDGTLVTDEKKLTDEAVRAVQRLGEADVRFALTSGRPPRGLAMLVDPLGITTPLSGFNGGMIVDTQFHVVRERVLADDIVAPMIALLEEIGLSVWLYRGEGWYVLDSHGPHVQSHERAVEFAPLVVANFDGLTDHVVKVVGVTDDAARMNEANAALNERFVGFVSATCSSPYYLDVTHPDATKGGVVAYLADHYGIDPCAIATIGDMSNDVSMFESSGLSVAMGNAPADVQRRADHVTSSNEENGFAHAIDAFILAPYLR